MPGRRDLRDAGGRPGAGGDPPAAGRSSRRAGTRRRDRARAAARRAGRDGRCPGACGIDPVPHMLELARDRCGDRVDLQRRALAGPGSLPGGPFDAVACLQVLEFATDVRAALTELHRVLRPGGRLLVLDTDWTSLRWPGPGVGRHRRIRDAWCTCIPSPRLPCELVPLLRAAGFASPRAERVPMRGPAAAGYGAVLREMVAVAVPGRCGLSRAEVDTWATAVAACGDEPFSVDRWFVGASRP
ncbi:methyltransferase domain-containing protein [Pseudonocardia nantongensis]|uniref:methyltransferase domain-containing protein n=1 Tax=Pseudonocardia nantongensis TaxID=1181885 RepID=UPI003979D355